MAKRKKIPGPTPAPAAPAQPTGMVAKLRESLTSAVVGSLVTGLVALGGFCALPLYNAHKDMRDIQVPLRQAMDDDRVQIDSAKQFTDRAFALVDQDEAAVVGYFGNHPSGQRRYYSDAGRKGEALATAARNLLKADQDLGSVSAYDGQLALVPATYNTAAEGYFRAAANVWTALSPLAESATPGDEQKAFDAMTVRWGELTQAKSNFLRANDVLVSSLKRKQVDEQRAMEKGNDDFKRQLLKERLAAIGLVGSVTGILGILGFILWPKLKP